MTPDVAGVLVVVAVFGAVTGAALYRWEFGRWLRWPYWVFALFATLMLRRARQWERQGHDGPA